MQQNEKVRKIFATVLLLAVIALVAYALFPFFNAFFGAIILFFLFKPLYIYFHKKGLSKTLSATLVVITSLLVIIIPIAVGITLVVQEVSGIINNPSFLVDALTGINKVIPILDVKDVLNNALTVVAEFSRNLLFSLVDNVTRTLIQLLVTYFVFYFLLIDSENMDVRMKKFIPFNEKNATRLLTQFKKVTQTTIVTAGLIALMQGTLLALGWWVLGIEGAFFWGFIAVVISFLPVVGVPLIWGTASAIHLLSGNLFIGFSVLAWGAFISTIDNFLRPYLQHRMGEIHPVITIVGVFMGLPIFGLLGIIIGPLLLFYIVSITEMYMEEYV